VGTAADVNAIAIARGGTQVMGHGRVPTGGAGERDTSGESFVTAAFGSDAEVERSPVVRGPTPVKSDRPLQGAWEQRAAPATGPNGSEDVMDYAEDDGDGQGNIENKSSPMVGMSKLLRCLNLLPALSVFLLLSVVSEG